MNGNIVKNITGVFVVAIIVVAICIAIETFYGGIQRIFQHNEGRQILKSIEEYWWIVIAMIIGVPSGTALLIGLLKALSKR